MFRVTTILDSSSQWCSPRRARSRKRPRPTCRFPSPTPTEGDTLGGTAVHIALGATGIEIAPAADARPETAHHHLYLDVDFPQVETAIPMGVAGVVHLGQAQTEFHWDNVPAGPHRIIAVLADPGHIPLRPWVTDTVHFYLKAPAPDTTTKK